MILLILNMLPTNVMLNAKPFIGINKNNVTKILVIIFTYIHFIDF